MNTRHLNGIPCSHFNEMIWFSNYMVIKILMKTHYSIQILGHVMDVVSVNGIAKLGGWNGISFDIYIRSRQSTRGIVICFCVFSI